MSNPWKGERQRILLLLIAAALAGWSIGYWLPSLLAFSCAYLIWHLSQLLKVVQWLRNGAPERAEAIVANLFLHQFSDGEVREMLAGAARKAGVVAALEPRRSRAALLLSRCLWLLGCNAVTRHDAPVSVRAGFAGKDLSALWPDAEDWELTEWPVGWCSHLFVARRKEIIA